MCEEWEESDELNKLSKEELMEIINDISVKIKTPLSPEYKQLLIDEFLKRDFGTIEVISETYALGVDEEGYILLANITPQKDNPKQAYYFLHRNPDFKKLGCMQYKVEYMPSWNEDEEDDIEEDQNIYVIGHAMNLISIVDQICMHWTIVLNELSGE